jgi:hypothetical protein
MTQSLQKSNQEIQTAIEKPSNITAYNCVKSQALCSYFGEQKEIYHKAIEKAIAKLFYALGHTIEIKRIEILTELLIDSRKYESPETILLFLYKCSKGELGKFYGLPGIDQLQEKFSDFLQYTIVPQRENIQQKEPWDNDRDQPQSIQEFGKNYIKYISGKK